MTKGNLSSWMKEEGEAVAEGDVIAQIETDKATVDFDVSEEGFLAKILIPAGSKDIPLGQVCPLISFHPYNADILLYKPWRLKGLFQFEISIIVLVSFFHLNG